MEIPLWSDERQLTAALAHRAGLNSFREEERVTLLGGSLEARLRDGGVFVVELGKCGFAGILRVRGSRVDLLDAEYKVRTAPLELLVDAVLKGAASEEVNATRKLLDECGLPAGKGARAARAILSERLCNKRVGGMRRLTLDPAASMWRQIRETRLLRAAACFISVHTMEAFVWLAIWQSVGAATLAGRLDPGWMWGWLLLLAALAPLHFWAALWQGRLSIALGGLLKQRLLAGALRLPAGEVAQEGAGRFFSRLTEAEAVETLALSGGLSSLMSIVELSLAGMLLTRGAGGAWLLAIFVAWLFLAVGVAWRYGRKRDHWTVARLDMTHNLIERMTGHRTVLVQEPVEPQRNEQDEALSQYHATARRLDRWAVGLHSFLPQAWLLTGVAGLMPAFSGGAPEAAVAVGLGGVLLGYQALRSALSGLTNLIGAAVSWREAAPLFRAAQNIEREGAVEAPSGRTALHVSDLTFRYRPDGPPVLNGLNLLIERGDRVLLESPSGRGKSTLAALLSGIRDPASGVLTSCGLDRASIGARAWRKKVAVAPQYHENHIVTGSLAFNLLMGRAWPPTWEDLAEATHVCRELGLGELLERMPAGIQQTVGDTGWRLSQGERSRVFLARALLQNSELVILDESFAALDPENLRRSMECCISRAKTLMVVAHP
jgi:ATP-binding cassette subfamily B protein